jgi:hypothetical protein
LATKTAVEAPDGGFFMPIADGLGWPAGKPLAISLSVMLEGRTDGGAPGVAPTGKSVKPGTADLPALSR